MTLCNKHLAALTRAHNEVRQVIMELNESDLKGNPAYCEIAAARGVLEAILMRETLNKINHEHKSTAR
jgi:hypothetical protein